MDIKAGSTSRRVAIVLRAATDNSELTGKVAADITATYWREGELPIAITLSDLATVNAAWASGGVKEAEATRMKGTYRLDLPDAAVALGAAWMQLEAFTTGSRVWKERFPLPTTVPADVAALVSSLTATLTANPAGIKKNTALPNFTFEMVDSLTGAPKTGLSVLVQRRLDAGTFLASANAATEIGDGIYTIDLAAADLNGDVVTLRLSAAGARQRTVTIITEP